MELALLNTLIVSFEFVYLLLRYRFLNPIIPLWFTKPWGEAQLADKSSIVLIPLTSLVVVIVSTVLSVLNKKTFIRYGSVLLLVVATFCNSLLLMALIRIINRASTAFSPLIDPNYVKLFFPFVLAFALVYLITPRFIEFVKKRNIVTDPSIHAHPGMLLKKPSARGGGVIFSIAFSAATLLVARPSVQVMGIVFAVLTTAVIGFLDDVANTNPYSKLKLFGNPVFRLLVLQPIPVLFVFFSGVRINNIGGIFQLNDYLVRIGSEDFAPLAIFFTLLWMIWVMNMLSFSNGVDGQYSGIVGISSVIIAILSLRFSSLTANQLDMAKIAAITAGAGFALTKYTWHPSKIMWGFSATSAGIILATLSIVSVTKIAIAVLVLLIPFLDAVITVVRRALQGKAPWKGDRGHLHHLLLERGWSVPKIATFYWITTAVLGATALFSSEKNLPLVVLTLSGVVAFILIVLNLKSEAASLKKQLLEK